MRSFCPSTTPSLDRRRSVWRAFLLLLLVSGLLAPHAGCRGCRTAEPPPAQESEEKRAQGPEKKKKVDIEIGEFVTLPSDDAMVRSHVKPGHCVTAWMKSLANNFDLRADLETSVTDSAGHPIPIAGTEYHLLFSRPAVLPKGQVRYLQSTYFIPAEVTEETSAVFLQNRLQASKGGSVAYEGAAMAVLMPDYQYQFVVLCSNPNAYGYVKQLESVRPPFEELLDEGIQLLYYQVVLPTIMDRVPMSSHPFAWTSIAYLLWDDLLPERLTPDQQQAMIDWLHWGGQLIVSGPGSIDQLSGSFLDPYLPAIGSGAVGLVPDDFKEINQSWSLQSAKSNQRFTLDVLEESPMIGVRLEKHADAEFIRGTGKLVVERRVGRGRIVVTGFSLRDDDLVNWGSYDSFFNSCLLRRPARLFSAKRLGSIQTDWAVEKRQNSNPLFVTGTRYFTRDAGPVAAISSHRSIGRREQRDWHLDGSQPHASSGTGGWNDQSGPSLAAHQALRDAAGISIPEAGWVLAVLAGYLLILVPVNWGVCRLLNRVEWAWVAAPIISLLAAIAVIRLAQLDIGFVRSRTEIAILETHGGYPRAHLTRYTALYSSLSSAYELQFEDSSAIARPFPPTISPDRPWPVTFRRDRQTNLSGFQIESNTTGFVHTEQMFDLGGQIELIGDDDDWRVRNNSRLDLYNVGVLYRTSAGRLLTCQLGALPSTTTRRIQLDPSQDGTTWLPQWEWHGPSNKGGESASVDLESVTRLASSGVALRPGDMRLIAWSDDDPAGTRITPHASQTKMRSLVLVHLRFGKLPAPRPDVNLAIDLKDEMAEPEDGDELLEVFPKETNKQDQR